MLSNLLNRRCTIITRTASGDEDDYGNDLPGETVTETVCEIQQRQRDEPGDQGELSVTGWLLILPAGTLIRTGDSVVIDGGHEYEVVGDPWPLRNPRTQQESHIEASVRRTAGDEETGS